MGFSGGSDSKEYACKAGDLKFSFKKKNKGIILASNILMIQLEFMFYKFKVKAKLFK